MQIRHIEQCRRQSLLQRDGIAVTKGTPAENTLEGVDDGKEIDSCANLHSRCVVVSELCNGFSCTLTLKGRDISMYLGRLDYWVSMQDWRQNSDFTHLAKNNSSGAIHESIKCLPDKHEVLNFESPVWWRTYNASSEVVQTTHASLISGFQNNGTPFQKTRGMAPEQEPKLPSVLHTPAHMCEKKVM